MFIMMQNRLSETQSQHFVFPAMLHVCRGGCSSIERFHLTRVKVAGGEKLPNPAFTMVPPQVSHKHERKKIFSSG